MRRSLRVESNDEDLSEAEEIDRRDRRPEFVIRLNIACPRTLLADGLERTVRVLERRRD